MSVIIYYILFTSTMMNAKLSLLRRVDFISNLTGNYFDCVHDALYY